MISRVSDRIIDTGELEKGIFCFFLPFFFFLLFSEREHAHVSFHRIGSSHLRARIRIERSWKSANAETPLSRLIDFRQLRAEQTDSHTPLRDYNPQEGSTKGVWHRLPTFLRLPIRSPPGQSSTHRNFESLWIIAKPNSVSIRDSKISGQSRIIHCWKNNAMINWKWRPCKKNSREDSYWWEHRRIKINQFEIWHDL